MMNRSPPYQAAANATKPTKNPVHSPSLKIYSTNKGGTMARKTVPTSRILSPEKIFRWLAAALTGAADGAVFASPAACSGWLDGRGAAVGLKNLRQPRCRFVISP